MTARACGGCGSALWPEDGRSEVCLACAFGLALDAREGEPSPKGPCDEPRQVGPYRLLERIAGESGDEVWLAEQIEAPWRPVTLRLLSRGAEGQRILARFEAEREALALLDHPCLLSALDAGTTEDGRAFLVTACVSSATIAAHCEHRRLSAAESIALFLRLCEGVQHAHERGIYHLDLNPSSVRVEIRRGVITPKVSVLGRPSRSAPEPRIDVHALGLLLHGPLDPPSGRHEELEWIAARALEHGYGSATELAADVRRHLRHEPVLAGPSGLGYRTRSLVRRHRLLVAAVALVFLAVVAFYLTRP